MIQVKNAEITLNVDDVGLPRDPGVYPPENPWKNLLAEMPANFKTLVRNAAIETAMTLDRILFGQVDFGSLIEPRPKLFEAPKVKSSA